MYQENDVEEEWKDKIDNIFVIDEKLTLFKVHIIRKESEVMSRVYLGDMHAIKTALENKVRDKEFVRLGISDRCISIGGKIYSLKTGYYWDFIYQGTDHAIESDK